MEEIKVFFDDESEEYVWMNGDSSEICFIRAIPDATTNDNAWAVFDAFGEVLRDFDELDMAVGWATRWALRLTEDWFAASDGPPYDAATATGMYDG